MLHAPMAMLRPRAMSQRPLRSARERQVILNVLGEGSSVALLRRFKA
jgi:hypothetical protein